MLRSIFILLWAMLLVYAVTVTNALTAQDTEEASQTPGPREAVGQEQIEAETGERQYPTMRWWMEKSTLRRGSDPFVRQGPLGGEQIKVAADDVLNAMAEGRDIRIERALIEGDLDIGMIASQLQRDESGKIVVRGDIEVRFSEIRGDMNFSSTRFGEVIFIHDSLTGIALFDGATFSDYASFSSTTFGRDADFREAMFERNVDFITCVFSKDASFADTNFHGYAFFRSTIFSTNASFTDAIFRGATDFADVTFAESADFLRASLARHANFNGLHYRENTVLAGLWNDVFCRIISFLTAGKVNIPKRTVTDFMQFDTGSIMDGSSNPYLKRYIDDEQWIRSWRESTWWRVPLFVLWEATSHCGRSIGLWAFWSAFIAFGYAIIYSRFLSDSITFNVDRLSDTKPCFRSYLYYSVVTLTTLGYGDIIPLTNMARLVVGAEVVTGYVMLGGLVSIFATKFAIRS